MDIASRGPAIAPVTDPAGMRPIKICLINPRFEPSYWGGNYILPLVGGGKKCWAVTGALPALAALVPPHCSVEIVDENVETIDFAGLGRFDVIGVTGMVVQATRMREILVALRDLPAKIVVGGPYVSVAESQFEGLCDSRFIGEAEETWPAYLTALGRDEPAETRYEQSAKTDMTTVPVPRYDLIKASRYAMATLQFSRGCPFMCEFCDIITIFGRRPRLKTPSQMIAEFDVVRKAGFSTCFLVDDNFIGNKAKVKELLPLMSAWQREHGYPIEFNTEASINLADDPELIELMLQANITSVFVGIESPRASSLNEIRKVQNVRGDSMLAKLDRIRDGGIDVSAGFIVGFDSDDEDIFEEQYRFIEQAGIVEALVAVLTPIPTTPLYDRLLKENRLDFEDNEVIFRPSRMSRETLKRGYAALMKRLYEPEAFFARALGGNGHSAAFHEARRRHRDTKGSADPLILRLRRTISAIRTASRLARAVGAEGCLSRFGAAYWRAWRLSRRGGVTFDTFVNLCSLQWHFHKIAHGPRRGAFGAVLPPELKLFDERAAAA